MTDQQKIEQLFASQTIMTVAVTLDDGTPWAVPVAIRAREGMHVLEWDSVITTVHSQAIAGQPQISVTVYQKTSELQIGYYAKGRAELAEEYKPGMGRYRFTANKAWINDETFKKRPLILP